MPHLRVVRARRRGSALLAIVTFVAIDSLLVGSSARLASVSLSRAAADASYAAALDLAEAAINYELHRIAQDVNSADTAPFTVRSAFGAAGRSFRVQCVNRGAGAPWSGPGTSLDILGTGMVDGIQRTVRASVAGTSNTAGGYAVYAVQSALFSSKATINGAIGTNGSITASDVVSVNGRVELNGGGASSSGRVVASSRVAGANAVNWPPVHDVALARFPQGGLAWLAAPGNNDNALCSAIHSNQISTSGSITLPSKPGGANYYLTRLVCQSGARLKLDNSQGPVTLWLGPDGGAGSVSGNPNFDFQSGATISYTSTAPGNVCRIYDSTSGPFTLESDASIDVGIYAYNRDARGAAIGSVDFRSPTKINGSVIANTIKFEAEGTVNYQDGYYISQGTTTYGFANTWVEIRPR